MRSLFLKSIGMLLVLLATPAHAQIGGWPAAPNNLAPANYEQRGTLTGDVSFDIDFTFRASLLGSVFIPAPTMFAVCLLPAPASGTAVCDWITKRWSAPVTGGGGLTRRQAYNSKGLLLLGTYDYRFDPPTQLEEPSQDIPLVWTVAACAPYATGPGGFRCTPATWQNAYFVASNLTATSPAYSRPNGTYLDIDIRATTIGSRAVDGSRFDVRIDVWEGLYTFAPNGAAVCRYDYWAADIQSTPNSYAVILVDGRVFMSNQVPAGTPDTDIAGIYALGAWAQAVTTNTSMYGPPQSLAADLGNPRGVFTAQITPTTNGRGFIVRGTVDSGGRLKEFIETDNASARCKAF